VTLPDLSDAVVLVTGGTSGVGRAAAERLGAAGATVVLTGRDPERGQAAAAAVADAGTGDADIRLADFGDLEAVRDLAAGVRADYDRLDALVNNAGCSTDRRRESAQGLEYTFAVNHLAHFLLAHRLADRLVASAPARVVTVASGVHTRGDLDLDAVKGPEPDYDALDAYARSKLANVCFALELADRLDDTGVASTALHPGFVPGSRIWRDAAWYVRAGVRLAGAVPGLGSTVAEAGARLAALAADPAFDGVTGAYVDETEVAEPAPAAKDPDARARLWAWSAEHADVDPALDV